MSNILLDYFFPITVVEPTPQASTAFLKQVCLVVKPTGTAEVITPCTSMTAVGVVTNNLEAQQLFDAGMQKVYILAVNDLDMSEALAGVDDFYTLIISSDFTKTDFDSVLASGAVTIDTFANLLTTTPDTITVAGQVFTAQAGAVTLGDPTFRAATSDDATAASLAAQINAHAVTSPLVTATVDGSITDKVNIVSKIAGDDGNDITLAYADLGGGPTVGAILSGLSGGKLSGGAGFALGGFKGVVAISETDDSFLTTQAAIQNRCAFHTTSGNKAKNMCFAFGSLLSNLADWLNQQYITMPVADDITNGGDAATLFTDKVSFVLSDSQFGNRLALFACGGKAIVAPYIEANLSLDLQSKALQFISGNEPSFTVKNASLIEDELKKVIQSFIDLGWIVSGIVAVTLGDQTNFVATANMVVPEPTALWRIVGELRQS